jgi:hypothetical protein
MSLSNKSLFSAQKKATTPPLSGALRNRLHTTAHGENGRITHYSGIHEFFLQVPENLEFRGVTDLVLTVTKTVAVMSGEVTFPVIELAFCIDRGLIKPGYTAIELGSQARTYVALRKELDSWSISLTHTPTKRSWYNGKIENIQWFFSHHELNSLYQSIANKIPLSLSMDS